MAGITRHLKQTVTLQRSTGEFNEQGESVYRDPEIARARKVPGFGMTVNELGVEVPNRTKLFMGVEVSVGDLIDDARVEGVKAIVNKRGRTIGYRVEL